MNVFLPWIRIVIAIFVYIAFALFATFITRRMDIDLKGMESRTSGPILLIGIIINTCILGIILLMLHFWDGLGLNSLGLSFTAQDSLYSISGIVIIFGIAVGLLGFWSRFNMLRLNIKKPAQNRYEIVNLIGGIVVLLVVASMEEVLFRGYLTLNLLHYNPALIILITALVFTLIHLITNKGGMYQITSWFIGGVLFSYIYLITGSIWVTVLLHFSTDLNNLLTFNITGKFSFFKLSPSLTKRQLAIYKLVSFCLLIAVLLEMYGSSFRLI